MLNLTSRLAKFTSVSAFALLAGCAQQMQAPAAPTAAYNPPGTALSALPEATVDWYRVTFASGSQQLDASARRTVQAVATAMQSNGAVTATVVGRADQVGDDASNMALSKRRANTVRNALLQAGVPAQRIETRWTGERALETAPPGTTAESNRRAVDIAVH